MERDKLMLTFYIQMFASFFGLVTYAFAASFETGGAVGILILILVILAIIYLLRRA